MPRKPELSATQLAASGMATVTATIGTSYLGVAGTLWGAAFMSVASTAGLAVYKHYLEQGKQQIWERTHGSETPQEVAETAADITRIDSTRTVVWPGGTHAGDPTEVIAGFREGPPPEVVTAEPGPSRAQDTMAWLKQRWVVLAASSAAVFAVVMGGVTVVEALADKPVSSIVGATDDKGTSFGNVGGGSGRKSDPVQPTDDGSGDRQSPSDRPSGPVEPGQTGRPVPPAPGPSTPPPTKPSPGPRPPKPTQPPRPTQPPGEGQAPEGGAGQKPGDQQAQAQAPGVVAP